MNNQAILNYVIENSKKLGANDVDAIIIDSTSLGSEVRLGKLINISRSASKAIGVRILVNQQQSMVSSADLSKESLDNMIESAIQMAKVTPKNEHLFLAKPDQLAKDFLDLDLYDANEPSAEELIELAKDTEEFALSNKDITNSEGAGASYGSSEISFATSNGFLRSYKTSTSSFSVSVIAGEDENMQTDYSYSYARHKKDLKTSKEVGNEAAKRVVAKLNPKKINTCEMPVIFDIRVARSLLGSFASAINGAAISRGTSFLLNSLGEQVFNSKVNIIDDPFIVRGIGSRNFDAEGISGSKLNMIENGIVTNYFLDLQTASKLNMKTTGHASRGLSSSPLPSYSNLYMLGGEFSVEEMIKSLKKGIIITETFGHGANIITGEYSQGAGGFYFEDGEILYPVSEITIAGNLKKMFQILVPANDLKFESSINSPSLLIENMVVAGK